MKEEYNLRKELKTLESIRGSGTELITIYVPPDFPISDEIARLRSEYGQASNIKSKTTRLNVQSAIERIIQYLKVYRDVPENGLAVFCGNVSNVQSKSDIELYSLLPPQPIKANIYRCDSSFLLEPIQKMAESTDNYALLVMDGRDATLAVLKGTEIVVDKKIRSFAHQKVHKGGQSAARYDRAIGESIDDYYKSIADSINELFLNWNFKLKGLVVGGPGPSKENFVKSKNLNYQIKILGVFDTGYTDESMGLNELLEKAREVLSEQQAIVERVTMEKFLNEVSRNGLAVYGYNAVKDAVMKGNVSKLLVSDQIELTNVTYKCNTCDAEFTKLEKGNEREEKHECGGNLEIIKEEDAVENIISMADKNKIETLFISADSQYGKELLLGFEGLGALLRYKN
jgi:peptide chain release factor subunit 1